jgi:predicted ATPase
MSLSRLWLAQDQPHAAQGLLAEIYGGFTEGLETADLQAAQDLLARCHAAT